MIFADSHAHIDFPDFNQDLAKVMERAWESGVGYVNVIGTDITKTKQLLSLCEQFPNVYCSAGIHPHNAGRFPDITVGEILAAASHTKVRAIGETGLDFFYDKSPKEVQIEVFRRQIQAAHAAGLPLVIHSRDAEEVTRQVMEEEQAQACGGVIHCFTGSEEFAQWGVDQGFYISFSGIVTFRTAQALRDVAKTLPLDRLLIETDAPYLAPVPHRGKRNEPGFVVQVAETLAQVRDISLEEVAQATTENYRRLFGVEGFPHEEAQEKETPEILAYPIGRALYLNVTRGCTLKCTFCPKWSHPQVHDYDLTLKRNPDAQALIQAMGDPGRYEEIVFCGFGEPTLRLEVMLAVAREVKRRGDIRVRLNTDGLANRVYGRDVTPRFKGLIDAVSVSLNAQDEATYDCHCKPAFGGAWQGMLDFIRAAKKHVPEVTATAIDGLEGVDMEACRRLAEDELGVGFRARHLNRVG
ncbi:MAG: YchF/TatD family DNA exonuclease [Magnetococcales bacterium]|nr:YchF/TatD family DNA exonuclease [Magnetococcales bacterium]